MGCRGRKAKHHKIVKTKSGKFRIKGMAGKAGPKWKMRARLAAYHINKKKG